MSDKIERNVLEASTKHDVSVQVGFAEESKVTLSDTELESSEIGQSCPSSTKIASNKERIGLERNRIANDFKQRKLAGVSKLWTSDEVERLNKALKLYKSDMVKVAAFVGTKSRAQCSSKKFGMKKTR